MAGMGDISELLGDQPVIDESTLPDAGTDAADEGLPLPEAAQDQGQNQEQDQYAGRKHVPLGALQEERTRRQELQQQLQAQQEMTQRMQERFNQIMERMQPQQPQQPQQPPEPEIPAFIDDPEGHINGIKAQFQRELEEVRAFYQNQMGQQQATAQGHALAQRTAADEAEFAKVTPDYPNAAQYFAQRRAAEYAALNLDPVTVQQMVARDYQGLAINAAQRGVSAAKMLYDVAKAMGFSSQPQAPTGQKLPPRAAPTSLGAVGGAPASPEDRGSLTLEALADMSDAEFDKFWSGMERGSKQRPKV